MCRAVNKADAKMAKAVPKAAARRTSGKLDCTIWIGPKLDQVLAPQELKGLIVRLFRRSRIVGGSIIGMETMLSFVKHGDATGLCKWIGLGCGQGFSHLIHGVQRNRAVF